MQDREAVAPRPHHLRPSQQAVLGRDRQVPCRVVTEADITDQGDQIADASGVGASGYLATNVDVEWSTPKGTSLIGATGTGALAKREATTAKRTDVSYLSRHDWSAYHPAGKAIVSIGTGREPGSTADSLGIWLATNLGTESRLLVRDESAAAISEPTFDADGTALYFLADHGAQGSHVHFYVPGEGTLAEAWEGPGRLQNLSISRVDNGAWAVNAGPCQGAGKAAAPLIVAFENGLEFELDPVVDLSTRRELRGSVRNEPVGWLPGKKLLVLARSTCNGPGTLWSFSPNGAAVKVATGVTAAAPRPAERRVAKELEVPINAQVVA
jgi:hypothetical protein